MPVDARIESGRTPIHALERLWEVERFDRIVVPAPTGREPGFTPEGLMWMLTNAPSETLVLRPDPAVREAAQPVEPEAPRRQRQAERAAPDRRARVPALVD